MNRLSTRGDVQLEDSSSSTTRRRSSVSSNPSLHASFSSDSLVSVPSLNHSSLDSKDKSHFTDLESIGSVRTRRRSYQQTGRLNINDDSILTVSRSGPVGDVENGYGEDEDLPAGRHFNRRETSNLSYVGLPPSTFTPIAEMEDSDDESQIDERFKRAMAFASLNASAVDTSDDEVSDVEGDSDEEKEEQELGMEDVNDIDIDIGYAGVGEDGVEEVQVERQDCNDIQIWRPRRRTTLLPEELLVRLRELEVDL